tara:strand:- start:143 stop:457 length:315 start_codon:yes stop_codon:yes gene_type:complete
LRLDVGRTPPYVISQMLRQILMLMALLSGLTALCAPEQALASQDQASQLEMGEAQHGEAEKAAFAADFDPVLPRSRAVRTVSLAPVPQLATAPRVAIGVDRARE